MEQFLKGTNHFQNYQYSLMDVVMIYYYIFCEFFLLLRLVVIFLFNITFSDLKYDPDGDTNYYFVTINKSMDRMSSIKINTM